jgi:hypothetical protein
VLKLKVSFLTTRPTKKLLTLNSKEEGFPEVKCISASRTDKASAVPHITIKELSVLGPYDAKPIGSGR